jgi:hypothetical protein
MIAAPTRASVKVFMTYPPGIFCILMIHSQRNKVRAKPVFG